MEAMKNKKVPKKEGGIVLRRKRRNRNTSVL